jgi:exodeoxyribonuclease VII small subunit
MNYKDAYTELQTLVETIEDDNVALESLAEMIAKANELIVFCENKLRDIEAQTSELLDEEEG